MNMISTKLPVAILPGTNSSRDNFNREGGK